VTDAVAAQIESDCAVAGRVERVEGAVVLLTPDFSSSWELNKVRLDPGAGPEEVARGIELAEEFFAGFAHRRVCVPLPEGEVVAPPGWQTEELLLMVWSGGEPPWPEGVRDITADELFSLRVAAGSTLELARIQAPFDTAPDARALALFEADEARGWCVLHGGCIDDVYVHAADRGRGFGKAITLAGVAAGGWFLLCDVDDPRPQGLYRALGFTDAGRVVNLTRA
jgi:ribosomal protein S18 acetylase RimI-like enzyme